MLRNRILALHLLLAPVFLAGCSADPVSPAFMGLRMASALASGVSNAADAAASPAERIQRRLPEHCSRFAVNGGRMQCVAYYPKAPAPFGITSKPQPQDTSASPVHMAADPGYAQCLFNARVAKEGKISACR